MNFLKNVDFQNRLTSEKKRRTKKRRLWGKLRLGTFDTSFTFLQTGKNVSLAPVKVDTRVADVEVDPKAIGIPDGCANIALPGRALQFKPQDTTTFVSYTAPTSLVSFNFRRQN